MELICAPKVDISDRLYRDLAVYRYEIYVRQLKWRLRCRPGMEVDQFDRDDTQYVVLRDSLEAIRGFARLLPTVRPYLLNTIFPSLFQGQPVPCDDSVWEVSRFTAWQASRPVLHSARDAPRGADGAQHHALSRQLACAVLERAAKLGAKRLLSVSSCDVEDLLRKIGVSAKRIGAPVWWNGQLLLAHWIDVH